MGITTDEINDKIIFFMYHPESGDNNLIYAIFTFVVSKGCPTNTPATPVVKQKKIILALKAERWIAT